MAYDSEYEIKKALTYLDNLQDQLQSLYDSLSSAVVNGRHAQNAETLDKLKALVLFTKMHAHNVLTDVKSVVEDVLSAEKQFLEEVE